MTNLVNSLALNLESDLDLGSKTPSRCNTRGGGYISSKVTQLPLNELHVALIGLNSRTASSANQSHVRVLSHGSQFDWLTGGVVRVRGG